MVNLDSELNFDVSSGLAAVKFGAEWCGPCKKMVSTINQLESEFDKVKFISIDVDEVPTLAQKYRIKTLPTLLILEDGKELNRIVGLSLIDPLRKIFRDISKDK